MLIIQLQYGIYIYIKYIFIFFFLLFISFYLLFIFNRDCNAGISQYQIAEKPAGTPLRWLTDDVQMSLHYSEKVQKLYSGSTEGKLYIWDINDREEIGQLKCGNKPAHQDMVMDIKFIDSLDNILTCSMDKTIGLWDVYTGHRRQLYTGHTKGVLSVDYIDTLQIVVSAGFDHDIYLWGPFTGQLVKRYIYFTFFFSLSFFSLYFSLFIV